MERMENDQIGKKVYVGECSGSRSVGRPRKRFMFKEKKFGCQAIKNE